MCKIDAPRNSQAPKVDIRHSSQTHTWAPRQIVRQCSHKQTLSTRGKRPWRSTLPCSACFASVAPESARMSCQRSCWPLNMIDCMVCVCRISPSRRQPPVACRSTRPACRPSKGPLSVRILNAPPSLFTNNSPASSLRVFPYPYSPSPLPAPYVLTAPPPSHRGVCEVT